MLAGSGGWRWRPPPTGVGCDGCGTRAVGHGRRTVKVRDLPMADRSVVLVWAKRIWRCPDLDCEITTWSEEVDEIAAPGGADRAGPCRDLPPRGRSGPVGRRGRPRLRGVLAYGHGGGARPRPA